MWMMPLHLHVCQKSDIDEYDDLLVKYPHRLFGIISPTITNKAEVSIVPCVTVDHDSQLVYSANVRE